ncbi:MAG TPA: sulfate adenylyltransferase subunit CysN [Novimethylophilus sp.]|uniref:sulfate adenylyltransferase subunit CysN n=1 Tax=Novimethylophilus sp. TaxID=2137426 RepID=UPI002F3FA457
MTDKSFLDAEMELLRFTTAGSVDDGKSTLIGRLLVDSKGVFEDQLDAAKSAEDKKGAKGAHLALLTDGLQAEREQGITIDVAYRYFATPKRKFIIADTPGHEQYTRNMVTGASTAHLAIILIDARKGVLTQSRRHAYISRLLGIPHIVVAINKMDLVDYSQEVFDKIKADFTAFYDKLNLPGGELAFIPISALEGDMVVERGDRMPWYQGETLLGKLESAPVGGKLNAADFRFPVQLVSRPQTEELHDFRGYMGRIESGSIKVGDEITVLPSGLTSRIKEIVTFDGNLQEAFAPMSVTLTLEDERDISRGDIIVHTGNQPAVCREIEATLCWMNETPLQPGKKYLIKHAASTVKVMVSALTQRMDINTMEQIPAPPELKMNEIGRAALKLLKPIACDPYRENRATGAFIVIDDFTNQTVGAGMIE